MSEWHACILSDLGEVVTGATPPAKYPHWFGDESPFITPSDITSQDRRARPGRKLSAHGIKGLYRRLIPANSVCFVCIGATIGKLCLTNSSCITNQQINSIIPRNGTDARFLYYLLKLEATRIAGTASGAATPILNKTDFSAISVRVPQPSTQSAIGKALGGIDDLIENTRRRIELLERMAQTIYREWFVHFRYPGHEDVALVDSPLGSIPEGWAMRTFADIASFVNGFAFNPEHWGHDGRPIIKIKELKQGVTPDTPRCDARKLAPKYWVEPGDLLFSWSADLGAYRWSYEPGLLNQHLFTVIPTPDLSLAFLFRTLHEAMPQFRDRAQGTTMRHIKRAALSEVSTIVPPQSLIELFTDVAEPIDQQVISLRGASRQLAAIRDLVLPKLVTGQIDISNLNLDALVDSVA